MGGGRWGGGGGEVRWEEGRAARVEVEKERNLN